VGPGAAGVGLVGVCTTSTRAAVLAGLVAVPGLAGLGTDDGGGTPPVTAPIAPAPVPTTTGPGPSTTREAPATTAAEPATTAAADRVTVRIRTEGLVPAQVMVNGKVARSSYTVPVETILYLEAEVNAPVVGSCVVFDRWEARGPAGTTLLRRDDPTIAYGVLPGPDRTIVAVYREDPPASCR
jgi:hypothetical protein